MTGPSQAFQLGDVVEIIGPALGGIHSHVGERGKLSYIDRGEYLVSGLWYPASSLRLAEEELKVGDWVQVIGDSRRGYSGEHYKIFRITEIDHDEEPELGVGYSTPGTNWYPAKSLRKLTPEEVCHLKGKFTAEERLDSLEEYARESDARLAAIEHKQLCQAIDTKGLQLRLTPLEASQQEAVESPLDGEKRARSRLEARRLFVLRQIATGMQELCEGRGLKMDVGKFWLAELVKVEKQIAGGQ